MDNGASSYRRFLDGDDNGFTQIVRDYKDGLILYLNSLVGNISEAEELAEDTFVKLGIRRPRFDGKSTFRTWLYAIGRNVALDALRRRKRGQTVSVDEVPETADGFLTETGYLKKERDRAIHLAMTRLRSDYRQVLWLVYFEELSEKDTARIMKKSTHNVATLIYRARLALKSELIKEGYSGEDL